MIDIHPQLEPPLHDLRDIRPSLFYVGRVGAGIALVAPRVAARGRD